jgi:hypothetical protein
LFRHELALTSDFMLTVAAAGELTLDNRRAFFAQTATAIGARADGWLLRVFKTIHDGSLRRKV